MRAENCLFVCYCVDLFSYIDEYSFNSAEKGYTVHILVDGVSSQRFTDRSTALQRLSQAGAYMATSEMVMFQLMKNTAHPAFKTISGLCKETRAEQLPAL